MYKFLTTGWKKAWNVSKLTHNPTSFFMDIKSEKDSQKDWNVIGNIWYN